MLTLPPQQQLTGKQLQSKQVGDGTRSEREAAEDDIIGNTVDPYSNISTYNGWNN